MPLAGHPEENMSARIFGAQVSVNGAARFIQMARKPNRFKLNVCSQS